MKYKFPEEAAIEIFQGGSGGIIIAQQNPDAEGGADWIVINSKARALAVASALRKAAFDCDFKPQQEVDDD